MENTILIGVITRDQDKEKSKEYLDELEFLTTTAGGAVVKRFTQNLETPNPKTFLGSGKIKEVLGIPDPFSVTIDPGKGKHLKQIYFENPDIIETNAIKEELTQFAHSIKNNEPTAVTIEDGYNALDVAYAIIDKLKLQN